MEAVRSIFANALYDRRALVIGGTSGIGAGIAVGLREAGARVTITGATEAEVARACDDAALTGIAANRLDVVDDAAIRALIGGLDRLDILVNCAGIIRRGAEHEVEVFEQVIDINLTGTVTGVVLPVDGGYLIH